MALLTNQDFTGFSAGYAFPVGVDIATAFTGYVDIVLSTGVTQSVFDAFEYWY